MGPTSLVLSHPLGEGLCSVKLIESRLRSGLPLKITSCSRLAKRQANRKKGVKKCPTKTSHNSNQL